MKILLLIPPTDLNKSYGRLKKFSNPRPSIGIAYIAALLQKEGYDVEVLDAYVKESGIPEIIESIRRYSPDLVGISVLTPSADVVYEISRNLRISFPKLKIVMGNLHASLFSDEILSMNYADFVIHREGEYTMLELLKSMENGEDLRNIKGLSFRGGNKVIHNARRAHIEELDSLPFPSWDFFRLGRYTSDPRVKVRNGASEMQILASRGCPNQCTFCSSRTERSQGIVYRMRNPKYVVDEMVYVSERFGNRVFSFVDLAFPLVRDHAMGICDELIKRGLNKKFKWFTECRVRPLDKELLSLMKKAGCIRVNFGIESGNNGILRLLKKNFTVEDIKSAVKMAHESGILVDGMFMLGLPEETEETINQTIDLAIQLNLRYAIFNIFVPYPGCDLYDSLKSKNKIHYTKWSDFTSYPTYSGGSPVYAPDGFSNERLMRLQKKAMRRFYLRPKFIFSELMRFNINNTSFYFEGLKSVLFGH